MSITTNLRSTRWSNWAKNVTCTVQNIFYPTSEAEVVEVVRLAASEGKTLRLVGEGHSFSPVVQTDEYILSLTKLRGLIEVDQEAGTATAWAGTPIKEVNEALYQRGLAMINLGDIDVQSLAGATATGTHGTGTAFGNISSEIVGFNIVTADGQLRHCSREENTPLFEAGRISLGVLGVLTKITINVVPTYKLEYTSGTGNFDVIMEEIDRLNAENRNFEYYYFPYSETLQFKTSNETDRPVKHNRIAAYLNDVLLENSALQICCQLGIWFPRWCKAIGRAMAKAIPTRTIIDYSHRVYATVRYVRFKEMEYNIPIEHFDACMRAVKAQIETREYKVFFPIECRFVKGDDCWLSPAYQRNSAYIAVHMPAKMAHEPYFTEMEQLFMRYGGRPHWGKMHNRKAADLAPAYERWEDFRTLRAELDPHGMFLSPYLKRLLGV